MTDYSQYLQEGFNLPHDVVELPSRGKFYKNKKSALKVGYLTAMDENILLADNRNNDIISTLLRNKIYEPDFHPDELFDCDIEAILIFLRNTAFGSEYKLILRDPKTLQEFEVSTQLDELNIKKPLHEPDGDGLFTFILPVGGQTVRCKMLNGYDQKELKKFEDAYPNGVVAPVQTKRLEMQIMSIDNTSDKGDIAKYIQQMPIADSKFIRNSLKDSEPRLDLERVFTAPSGEKVSARVTFGAEFFRPFF